MSSLLLFLFNKVYRLEIQSVMLVFSTPLVNCCLSTFSLDPVGTNLGPLGTLAMILIMWG